MHDSIFALSSGAPPAAIAIVRISGPATSAALTALAGKLPAPRVARLRTLYDPETGGVLDSALILWFPGPATATGEDLAELHLHGGRAIVRAVLSALARLPGLRPAQAGEFTRRALDNGQIDLAQAEGLADLLSSETEGQRRNALNFVLGHFSRNIAGWQAQILHISAQVEAALDFGDEDDVAKEADLFSAAQAAAHTVRIDMLRWITAPTAERLQQGLSVVIAGPPNAGKSTLFNALLQRDAAITSPIAGTTRDVIEAAVALDGIAFRLMDTAGLHSGTGDTIEVIGMERAQIALNGADIILWLGDPAAAPVHPGVVKIAAQADRFSGTPSWEALARACDTIISAHSGAGITDLIAHMLERARKLLPAETETSLNARQRGLIAEAVDSLSDDPDAPNDPLLLAERLRLARAALDRITGKSGTEDMLDALFGRFCIGK
jgi:tRNA modification GTPase